MILRLQAVVDFRQNRPRSKALVLFFNKQIFLLARALGMSVRCAQSAKPMSILIEFGLWILRKVLVFSGPTF